MTRTPSAVKRALESLGSIAAMTSCTCLWTRAKSTSRPRAATPKIFARVMAWAALAAAIRDFDGTQPVLRQSPPILACSMRTTGTPKAAAAAATVSPPEPAPITQMSGVNDFGHGHLASRTSAASRVPDECSERLRERNKMRGPAQKARSTIFVEEGAFGPWVPDLAAGGLAAGRSSGTRGLSRRRLRRSTLVRDTRD